MPVGFKNQKMNKNPIHLTTSYKITYIESAGNYIIINCTGQHNRQMFRYKIRDIEKEGIDSNLLRVHNRYVVNISKVKEFIKKGRSHFVLMNDDKTTIPVSAKYRSQVRSRLDKTLLYRDIIYTRNDPGYPF